MQEQQSNVLSTLFTIMIKRLLNNENECDDTIDCTSNQVDTSQHLHVLVSI